MGIKEVGVDVRISRRTMWVGQKVYPLAHVARVEPLEFVPRRGKIITAYIRDVVSWLGLGLLGLLVAAAAGSQLPEGAVTVWELFVGVALLAVTVRMIRRLTMRTLYVLSIETSGSPHEVVASWDRNKIYLLRDQVVAAIDDPSVSYSVHINHIEASGDAVFGNKYGDIVHGDKNTRR